MGIGGTAIEQRAAELAQQRLLALADSHLPDFQAVPVQDPTSAVPRWLAACLSCITPMPVKMEQPSPSQSMAVKLELQTPSKNTDHYEVAPELALYSPDAIEAELWPAPRSVAPISVHERLHSMHAKKLHKMKEQRKSSLTSITSDSRLTLRERADRDPRPFCTPRSVSSRAFNTASSGRAAPGTFGKAERASLLLEPNAVISTGLTVIVTPPPRKGGGGGGNSVPNADDPSSPEGFVRNSGDCWVHERDFYQVLPGEVYGPSGSSTLNPPLSSCACEGSTPETHQKWLQGGHRGHAPMTLHEPYAALTTAARARYAGAPLPGPGQYKATRSTFESHPALASPGGTWARDGRRRAKTADSTPLHSLPGPSPVHYHPVHTFCSARAQCSSTTQ